MELSSTTPQIDNSSGNKVPPPRPQKPPRPRFPPPSYTPPLPVPNRPSSSTTSPLYPTDIFANVEEPTAETPTQLYPSISEQLHSTKEETVASTRRATSEPQRGTEESLPRENSEEASGKVQAIKSQLMKSSQESKATTDKLTAPPKPANPPPNMDKVIKALQESKATTDKPSVLAKSASSPPNIDSRESSNVKSNRLQINSQLEAALGRPPPKGVPLPGMKMNIPPKETVQPSNETDSSPLNDASPLTSEVKEITFDSPPDKIFLPSVLQSRLNVKPNRNRSGKKKVLQEENKNFDFGCEFVKSSVVEDAMDFKSVPVTLPSLTAHTVSNDSKEAIESSLKDETIDSDDYELIG